MKTRERQPGNFEHLKPCPFCGEDGTRNDSGLKPEVVRIQTFGKGMEGAVEFGVECYRCGARTIDNQSIADAIDRWNIRAKLRKETKETSR